MKFITVKTYEELSEKAADIIASQIIEINCLIIDIHINFFSERVNSKQYFITCYYCWLAPAREARVTRTAQTA